MQLNKEGTFYTCELKSNSRYNTFLVLGTSGKATRMCDETQVVPWQEPDMFNCTTSTFYQLRKQLHKIETGELSVNTFVGVRLAADLTSACANTPQLYGADVLVTEGILLELLQYELRQAGLNLTHSQDKDYVRVSEKYLHFCKAFVTIDSF